MHTVWSGPRGVGTLGYCIHSTDQRICGTGGRARCPQLGEQGNCLSGAVQKYDTHLATLVAPNGYKGTRHESESVAHKGMIRMEA